MPGPSSAAQLPCDLNVNGALTCKSFSPPTGCVLDASVAVPAANTPGVNATKVNRYVDKGYAQPNTTSTSETKGLHVAYAAGTILQFIAGCIVAPVGGATVTFDLKKNGTSVLTSVITLNSSSTPYVVQTTTISTSAYVAGDVFTIVVTSTAGGGTLPTGVFARMLANENPA